MHLGKLLGWSAIVLVVLFALLLAILLLLDVSVYRGPLQAGVSAMLGRPVKFEGRLSLEPSLQPNIVVEDIRIANPAWASRPDMLTADRLAVRVALLPLIRGHLRVLRLTLDGVDVLLEGEPGDTNNWAFGRPRDGPPSLPEINSLTLRRAVIAYRLSPERVYTLKVSEVTAALAVGQKMTFKLAASYRDTPFTLSLTGGTPAEFLEAAKPWPIAATARTTDTTLSVKGTMTRPGEGKGLDLRVTISGRNLSNLNPLLDVDLPAIGPYVLSGQITETNNRYKISSVSGRLGKMDAPNRLAITWAEAHVSQDDPVQLQLDGEYGDVPFMLALTGGTLTELKTTTESWPVKLTARAAGAIADIKGELVKPLHRAEFGARIKVHGNQLSELASLAEIRAPALGAYELSGHVTRRDKGYSVAGLAGFVGDADLRLVIARGNISALHGKPVALDADVSYKDTAFSVSFVGGTLPELMAATKALPITLKVRGADATLDIQGGIKAKRLDVQVKVRGERVVKLARLFDVSLPELGSYELSARLRDRDQSYTLTDLRGQLGGSDVAGALTWVTQGARPRLIATLVSRTLDVSGMRKSSEAADRNHAVAIPAVIPKGVDIDLELEIQEIVGAPVTIHDLALSGQLENGDLTLTPIRMSLPGATVHGRLELKPVGETAALTLQAATRRLELMHALKAIGNVEGVDGAFHDVTLDLTSRGRTISTLFERASIEVAMARGDVSYRRTETNGILQVSIERAQVSASEGAPTRLTVDGAFRDVPIRVMATSATLPELLERTVWPVTLSANAASASLTLSGDVARRFDEGTLELALALQGEQLDGLDALLEVGLPALGPYTLAGHLTRRDQTYALTGLEIDVAENHATGQATVTAGGKRTYIDIKLTADYLDLQDFFEREEITATELTERRVIPDLTIPTDWLRKVDLDVDFSATNVRGGASSLGNVAIKATLRSGELKVSTIKARLSGGDITAKLNLDVRGTVPTADLQATVQHLDYGGLLKALDVTDAIEGIVDIDIELAGSGRTLRGLLGRADGSIVLIGGRGSIAEGRLGLWGVDFVTGIMSVATVAMKVKKTTTLNCMIWPFDVTEGLARSDAVLIDMPRITVGGTGIINLETEELNMLLKPSRKRPSLLSVGPPVRITGTLGVPTYAVVGKAKFFGKMVLPFINPTFLLLTTEVGTGKANPCVAALTGEGTAVAKGKAGSSVLDKLLDSFQRLEQSKASR